MSEHDDKGGLDRRGFLRGGDPLHLGRRYASSVRKRWGQALDRLSGTAVPAFDFVAVEQAARRPSPVPLVRPPGAIAEAEFLAGCSRCGDCAAACPHDAIKEAPPAFGSAAGTPMIIALQNPCLMCVDTPCITACPEDVLQLQPPLRIATAKINHRHCISSQEAPCPVCADHCPVAGVIILVEGRPVIDTEFCTGCGICQWACPAPHNAVIMLPASERPSKRRTEPEAV